MRRTGHAALPVVDGPRLVGIVSRTDLLEADDRDQPVMELASSPAVTVGANDSLQVAL